VAEREGAGSSGEVRTMKRRREPALDADVLASSPSSCVVPDTKKRSLFKDPATPTNTRRVVSVLLPNNTKLTLLSSQASRVLSVEEFINSIRTEAEKVLVQGPKKRKRQVRWGPNVFLEDSHGYPIADVATLKKLLQQSSVTILVQVCIFLHCPLCCLRYHT